MATKITVNIEFRDGTSDIYIVDATTNTVLVDYRDGQTLGARHAGKSIKCLSGHAELTCSFIKFLNNDGIIGPVFTVPAQLTPASGDSGYYAQDLNLKVETNSTMQATV